MVYSFLPHKIQFQSDLASLDMHVQQTRAYGRLLDFDDNKSGVRSEVLAAVKKKTVLFC